MGMFHSTSGKWGYNLHQKKTSYELSKEVAIQLLKEEQRLRRLSSTQQSYTEADTNFRMLENITYDLQEKALQNVLGIDHSDPMWHEALIAFRNLRAIYQNDPDVNQLTDYFKYDMSRDFFVQKVNLETIKIVDLLGYYDFEKEINNFDQMPSSEELVANNTKTLAQFLTERNTNNLPVAIIGSSYS